MRALEHFHHRALAPAALIDAGDARHHAVAMHHLAHFGGRQEQVLALFIGNQKTETVRMAADAPGHHVHLARQPVQAAAVFQYLAVALHRAQAAAEGVLVALAVYVQRIRQFAKRQRFVAFGQHGENGFAAGHRVFVFLLFPFRHGVLKRFFGFSR